MSEEPEKTVAEDIVVTKYKLAGEIVNRVLKQVIAKCVDGASVHDICVEGDRLVVEECSKVFKKDDTVKKGIAFPTAVSLNNCICHFSPTKADEEVLLKDGDMVKIDMGAHIDGFIAVVAHTLIVGQKMEKGATTGKAADVMLAAYWATELAIRTLKPGTENYQITDNVTKLAEEFGCKPISGMLSNQLKQFRIEGDKNIIQNPSEAQRKDLAKCEIEGNEVWAFDVIISTGEGKGRESDVRTTIYKKTDLIYQLKMKASRALYSDVSKSFGSMPFNIRACKDDEKKTRLGLHECVEHKLLDPYNVLYEKEGELVAQFKFTVLLMENGTSNRITGLPFDPTLFKSEHSIKDASLKELLSRAINPKKKKAASNDGAAKENKEQEVPVAGDKTKNGK